MWALNNGACTMGPCTLERVALCARQGVDVTSTHGGRSSAWLERLVVVQEVGGSSPLGHPNTVVHTRRGSPSNHPVAKGSSVSTNVTELGPFERQLTVAVDNETLESAKNRAARRLSKDLKIKGFRPGKAPRKIVENTVGSARVKEEAIDEVLPEVVGEALDAANLEPAVTPSVDAVRDLEDGVEIDVRVTLWPELDSLPEYDGRKVEVDAPETNEEAIQDQLDRLRDQFAELETVQRSAVDGDYVAINLNASQNGEPIEAISATDLLYEVGSAGLLDGLDGNVIGRSAGAIEQFSTALPEGFGGDLAGTTVDIQVLVKEVKKKILPDLDDEWVSDYTEFDTVGELRGELEGRMEQMRLSSIQQDFQSKLMFELLEELDVDAPEAIITGEMDAIFHRFAHQLGENDIDFADYLELSGQSQEAFLEDLRAQATRSVHTDLLLDGVAERAGLEVTSDELGEAYEVLSTQVEESADALAARMAGTVQEKRITSDILRRKALDALVRSAVAIDQDGEVLDLHLDDDPEDEESAEMPKESAEDDTNDQTGQSATPSNDENTEPDSTIDGDGDGDGD